jgi:hypothetical protein
VYLLKGAHAHIDQLQNSKLIAWMRCYFQIVLGRMSDLNKPIPWITPRNWILSHLKLLRACFEFKLTRLGRCPELIKLIVCCSATAPKRLGRCPKFNRLCVGQRFASTH